MWPPSLLGRAWGCAIFSSIFMAAGGVGWMSENLCLQLSCGKGALRGQGQGELFMGILLGLPQGGAVGAESIPGTWLMTRRVLCGDGAAAGHRWRQRCAPPRAKLCGTLRWEAELCQICNGLRKKRKIYFGLLWSKLHLYPKGGLGQGDVAVPKKSVPRGLCFPRGIDPVPPWDGLLGLPWSQTILGGLKISSAHSQALTPPAPRIGATHRPRGPRPAPSGCPIPVAAISMTTLPPAPTSSPGLDPIGLMARGSRQRTEDGLDVRQTAGQHRAAAAEPRGRVQRGHPGVPGGRQVSADSEVSHQEVHQ
ncbi:ras-like protein family member 12 isoform X5 [Numida meleagris]|uniref:ras-like protein family member 12 isoform X5 n=1 Tax=Numida meleagris TaxID=8996 RepID=UPI000B3DF4DF|nr:ras-like protein family member 12 isoform X5 [Numida meleagris]